MMTDICYDYDRNNGTQNNMIDFTNYQPNNSENGDLLNYQDLIKIKDIKQQLLKLYIENRIYTMLLENNLNKKSTIENPFDSIYLCDLRPDKISPNNFQKIVKIANNITDLSNEITFDDGLDD